MSKVIKEILKDIDDEECYYVGTNGCLYQDLDKEQLLCIKDYITNLQQDISNYVNVVLYQRKTIDNLQQENEGLKEANKILEKNWLHYMKCCGKASEILHNLNDTLSLDLILSEIEHSENILQNGSEKDE